VGTATSRMEIAEALAFAAVELTYDDIPIEVRAALKMHFIDAYGCALGAVDADAVCAARRVAHELGGAGGSSLIGTVDRCRPDMAAFANGVAIRYLDYCDVFMGKEITPPAAYLSGVLAVAEYMSTSGRELVVGLAVLYETLLRLCTAASLRARGWDTVSFGAIASAAAVSRVLSLTFEETREAIAIATVGGPGLLQTRVGELSMWKGAASAEAARQGVVAGFLGRAGMTGPHASFEGEYGVMHQVTGSFALPPADLERIKRVVIKKYPAQICTQAAIEAALRIRARNRGHSPIASVEVYTFARAVELTASGPERWTPTTRETADHSLPYVVSAALLDGCITAKQFAIRRIMDADIHELMSKVRVHEDPDYTTVFPEQSPSRVEIRLDSGDVLSEELFCVAGHPKCPATARDVEEKFVALATDLLGDAAAGRLVRQLQAVDSLPDVSNAVQHFTMQGETG